MSTPEKAPAATSPTTPPAESLAKPPVTSTETSDGKSEKSEATSSKEEKLDKLEDVALDVKTEKEPLPVDTPKSEGETLEMKLKRTSLHVDIGNDKDNDQSSEITPTPLKVEETQRSSTTPIGLDSLLSPKDPDARFPLRESMASEATDEDSRFSTVLLSARQSMETLDVSDTVTLTATDEHGDDRRNTLSGNDIVTMVHRNRVHKKTASTSTIVSANNVPFSLSREEDSDSQRNSLDGQQYRLQEEFSRMQLDRQLEQKPTEAPSDVDWSEPLFYLPDFPNYLLSYL